MSTDSIMLADEFSRNLVRIIKTVPVDSSGNPVASSTNPNYTRGLSYASSATYTPAAAAYTANDVIATAQEFTAIGPASSEIIITSTSFQIADTAIISGQTSYSLALFSITPPTAFADNDAFDVVAANRASFLGLLPLGTPVDLGSTLRIDQDGINRQISVPASASLFGLLVTIGGYTALVKAYTVTLHTLAA